MSGAVFCSTSALQEQLQNAEQLWALVVLAEQQKSIPADFVLGIRAAHAMFDHQQPDNIEDVIAFVVTADERKRVVAESVLIL